MKVSELSGGTCEVCREGIITKHRESREFEHKGVKEMLPMQFSECNACESDYADGEDMRFNKTTMTDFKRRVDQSS